MTVPNGHKKRVKASTFSQGQPETLPSKAASIKYFPFLKNSLHRSIYQPLPVVPLQTYYIFNN